MPRKQFTLARAPHDGKWRFSLDLKLWHTIGGVLLSILALFAAVKAAVSSIVAATVANQVKAEIARQYQPLQDQWRASVEGQLGGLRRVDSELKEAITRLQSEVIDIYKTRANKSLSGAEEVR
jgi:hypothetical protein